MVGRGVPIRRELDVWGLEKYLRRKEHIGIILFDYSSAELTAIIGRN